MQHNKAIITDLSEAVDSPTGWTYCLSSECGEYVKIGKTIKNNLSGRIGQTKNTYYSDMKFSWAVMDCRKETAIHWLFNEFRCKFKSSDNAKTVDEYSVLKSPVHSTPVNVELFKINHIQALGVISESDLIEVGDVYEWDTGVIKEIDPRDRVQKVVTFSKKSFEEINRHPNQSRFINNLIEKHIAEREAAALKQAKFATPAQTATQPRPAWDDTEYSIFDFVQGRAGVSQFLERKTIDVVWLEEATAL